MTSDQFNPSLSRRRALRLGAGTALGSVVLPAAVVASATPAAASTFTGVEQFHGVWQGSEDGRRATLRIVVLAQPPSDLSTLLFTFTDLDRNETYSGNLQNVRRDTYDLSNITMTSSAGTKDWAALNIHTWNTDYASGASRWNGSLYPSSWTRSTVAPPYTPGPVFTGYNDWFTDGNTGHYTGHLDGRNASLTVSRVTRPDTSQGQSRWRSAVRFELWDLDRNLGFYDEYWEDDVQAWNITAQDHPLFQPSIGVNPSDGGTMWPINGTDTTLIPFFAWHGWNRNYVSGFTQWWDGRALHWYGIQFQRA